MSVTGAHQVARAHTETVQGWRSLLFARLQFLSDEEYERLQDERARQALPAPLRAGVLAGRAIRQAWFRAWWPLHRRHLQHAKARLRARPRDAPERSAS